MKSLKFNLFVVLAMGSFTISLFLFSFFAKTFSIVLWFPVIKGLASNADLCFCLDYSSLVFSWTVIWVSWQVFMYTARYMSSSIGQFNKLIVLLGFFVASMIMLCMSSSLTWAIVGWDGLGLTSFVLIIFYKAWPSLKGALTTFLINRIGDAFLVVLMGLLLSGLSLEELAPLLMLCAITKSAQIPFSGWLPLAMTAPTPVSSLVHSSTLVTAGVFLMLRFYNVTHVVTDHLLFFSATVTLIYAGLSALTELDVKKIIAFSTLSHLSLMFIMISSGLQGPALLHMSSHAMFKSTLFMISGQIFTDSKSVQDARLIKALVKANPELSSLLMISVLSMMGVPALTGFLSKEVMLESCLLASRPSELVLTFPVLLLGVVLTAGYSARILLTLSSTSKYSSLDQSTSWTSWSPFWPSGAVCIWLSWILLSSGTSVIKYETSHSLSFLTKSLVLISVIFGFTIGMVVNKGTGYKVLLDYNSKGLGVMSLLSWMSSQVLLAEVPFHVSKLANLDKSLAQHFYTLYQSWIFSLKKGVEPFSSNSFSIAKMIFIMSLLMMFAS